MTKAVAWQSIVILVLACGLVFAVWNVTSVQETRQLVADGSADTRVAPDEVVLSMSVDTLAQTASAAQRENARVSAEVMAALEALTGEDAVETVSFSVYPEYDYTETGRRLLGYKAQHGLTVTTADVGGAGALLDAAVQAGVHRVDGVQFRLSDGLLEGVRSSLIAEATGAAREKAEALASAAGVRLGRPLHISAGTDNIVMPFVAGRDSLAESAVTKLAPQDVDVSVSVFITYGIS